MDLTRAAARRWPTRPPSSPVGARTQWEVGGPGRPARRRCARRPASSRYEPADMTVTVGAGTSFAELDARARRARPGVRARSARSDARPSAASSRAGSRASAGCGTARSATTCSRCASSPPTAGREGRRPDGEERQRLRPAAPARRLARHARRARAGDAALPAPRRRSRSGSRADEPPIATVYRPGRDAVGRRTTCTSCSKATPADVDAQARGLDAVATRRRCPTGAHRGRISVAPGAIAALGRALDASPACAGARSSASAPCTSPADDGRRARARARAPRTRTAAGCCAKRAATASTASAAPLPNARAHAARSRTRSTRPASSHPGRLPAVSDA